MSVILRLIDKNHPLHAHGRYEETGNGGGFFASKNPDKYARTIFTSLSHPNAVAFIAKEFAGLPMQVRIALRTLCNDGNATGNVRKGVQRLNELLRGELLREEQRMRTSVRVETQNGVGYRRQVVNPSIAGAARKYGIIPQGK